MTHHLSDVPRPQRPGSHVVQLYDSDEALVGMVGPYLDDGLRSGEGVIVVATRAHEQALREALRTRGHEVDAMAATDRLLFVDAHEALRRVCPGEEPDLAELDRIVARAFARVARAGFDRVRVYGEVVDLLWQEGRVLAAVRIERWWNRVLEDRGLTLLCAYRTSLLSPDVDAHALEAVCHAHTAVVCCDEARLAGAIDRALDEVLGPDVARALRPLIDATVRPTALLDRAEHVLLWIRRNLPRLAGPLLARTRHHLSEAA